MNDQNTEASALQEAPTEEELEMMELNARRFEPLGPWQYFWTTLLYLIPGVGLIAMVIQAIFAQNVNRICFARSRLIILTAVVTILALVIAALYFTNSLYTVLYIIKLSFKTAVEEISKNIKELNSMPK